MIIVAGLSLRNLRPRVWDPECEYYLRDLKPVMISYADFHGMPSRRKRAMDEGLHRMLGVPAHIKIYLDNGSFYFLAHQGKTPRQEYEEFVKHARPDWYPIPQDFIPTPSMTLRQQRSCLKRTMVMNQHYDEHGGYVPVMHISKMLGGYLEALEGMPGTALKPSLALGGIVPNLLRTPKAISYGEILMALQRVKKTFPNKQIHVFGIGGNATVHLAALLGFDSVDSSGWRNRAARGLIQMPGSGDRMVTKLGSWKGRLLDDEERALLDACSCPACGGQGLMKLKAKGIHGFCNRATHNLWVLLKEASWVGEHLVNGTYQQEFRQRLDNTVYLKLIDRIWSVLDGSAGTQSFTTAPQQGLQRRAG